jgi:hypothetical protein
MAKIGTVTDASKVPNWTRNKKLYQQESEAIMALQVGQAIPIDFDTEEQALAARNTIRETLNKEMRRAMMEGEDLPMKGMVTTRVESGTTRAWFTMQTVESVIGGDAQASVPRESTSKGRQNQKSGGSKKK